MAIPQNITKEHLLQAIRKIDIEGIPSDGDSQYYDVIYDGKGYPPKLIVSYANLFANGNELPRNTFEGGIGTPCFKLLEESGFQITEKNKGIRMSYFNEIEKFLEQAQTSELKTSTYLKKYLGLDVKVSFGQGNLARVPWISFLGVDQSTSNGIYPVYLLYKEINKLVLAYGVSETKKPLMKWRAQAPTLAEYFLQEKLGDPKPYPNSFLFKIYDLNKTLEKDEIDRDLNEIIQFYKEIMQEQQNEPAPKPAIMEFDFKLFFDMAKAGGLNISEKLSIRFTAALLTKPFVILTGLSGSGKTKLAQAFSMWLCENENQYCIVPVGADWTNREPLLGYPNALEKDDYKVDDFGVLQLIIDANCNPDKPYFLILDEMNLSHVERYFADFLSVMESKTKLSLHSGDKPWNGIPSTIGFPQNLFIIGTVNIDETTYMFSPKVLDRANVIEFRVSQSEMEQYLNGHSKIDFENLAGSGAGMAGSFVDMAKDDSLATSSLDEIKQALLDFFSALKKAGAEFGYRSASEILRFVAVVNKIEPSWKTDEIMDAAIMQKLLPKVHGSRRKLEPVFKTLGNLCLVGNETFETLLANKSSIDFTDTSKIKYPISLEKILRMYDNLLSNGFTSYAEA